MRRVQDEELVIEQVGGYGAALPEGWRQAELITSIISASPGLLGAQNGNAWSDWTPESYGSAGLTLVGILVMFFLGYWLLSTAYGIVFGTATPDLAALDADELEELFESSYTDMTVNLKFKRIATIYAELKRRVTDRLSTLASRKDTQSTYDKALSALESLVKTVTQRLSSAAHECGDDPELAVVSADALERITEIDAAEDTRYQRMQEENFQAVIPDAAKIEKDLKAAVEGRQERRLIDAIVLAEAYDDVLTQAYEDAVMTLEEAYASEDRATELQSQQRLAEELVGLQQLQQLQNGSADGGHRVKRLDQLVSHVRDDGLKSPAAPARTVELTDDEQEPEASAVVHVQHEESVIVTSSNRAMDTVMATVHHQTQILSDMHTSQWSMEAYRIKRENDAKLQQAAEGRRKGRAARKHQAFLAAKTRKENLEQEMRERQMTFSLHNPANRMAHVLGNAELHRLKDNATRERKKQLKRQGSCDWKMLFVTVAIQALVFLVYYNNPYFMPKDFVSTVMEHRGVNIPAVATDVAGKGWSQLCSCLAETDSRLNSNEKVSGFLQRPPGRRDEINQQDAIAREFDGSRIRPGFRRSFAISYDDVVQRSVQDMSRVWLGPLADAFNLRSVLNMSSSFTCLLRMSVRLLIPTMVHTFFTYVRWTQVATWSFILLGTFMMWRPLKALAGPFYPLAFLSLAQCILLVILHKSYLRLRWRCLLAGCARNVRPLCMYIVVPVCSLCIAAQLGTSSAS